MEFIQESQQVDEHHTGRGHAELHLEERDGALAIAPDGRQDEEGGSALEEAAGAAGDHEERSLGDLGRGGLRNRNGFAIGESPKTISNSN